MKYILLALVAAIITSEVGAQTGLTPVPDTIKLQSDNQRGVGLGFKPGVDTAASEKKGKPSIWIGTGGFHYDNGKPDSGGHRFEVQYGMLDLGVNSLVDNTDYNQVPIGVLGHTYITTPHQTKDLFSLRQGKSINVNVYPIIFKARLYESKKQKITLATGLGLQLYNFRFNKPVSYISDPVPGIAVDTISFSKNKLAFDYLMVPLMLQGKTRISGGGTNHNGNYLVYGVGVTGGYLLSSWTKQISDERGKQKNHDQFNFRKTNLCVNGEIGLDGYIRLYASYQLTSLDNVLDQHPFSIGIRFLGF